VRGVVTEPMFLMLLAAGGIYLAAGRPGRSALFLLGFVFVVIGITLAQERKTQRALESLRDLSAPRAHWSSATARSSASPGATWCAATCWCCTRATASPPMRLLIDGQLEVDESLLTGEAVPVAKLPMAPNRKKPQRRAWHRAVRPRQPCSPAP
jgi:Ca2+-transporting ATPase